MQQMRSARRHFTYANVMSTVAVCAMVVGSTAYAAVALNSISSRHIVDDSVQSRDIRNATITSTDLASYAVGNSDLAANAVTGSKIATGSVTATDIADGSGSGLDADTLDGIDLSLLQQRGEAQACDAGSFITEVGSTGLPTCQEPGAATDVTCTDCVSLGEIDSSARTSLLPLAYTANGTANVSATGEPRDVVISKTVPAGTYVVNFSGDAYNASAMPGDERGFNCIVTVDGSNSGYVAGGILGLNDVAKPATNSRLFAITGTGTLGSSGDIQLECLAPVGTVSVSGILTAIRVQSVA